METISRDEVKSLIDAHEKVAIIDTLSAEDFEEGHIPGALSMPLEQLSKLAPRLLPDKDQQIITYCSSPDCTLSTRAAEELEALGYQNVSEYIGGKLDWEEAGYDLETADDMDEDESAEDDDEESTEDDLESFARRYSKKEADDEDEEEEALEGFSNDDDSEREGRDL